MTQLKLLERHLLLAFLLENTSNSELRELPEVVEILLRNQQWVIRDTNRCAYGHREKKPTEALTNRPAWIPRGRAGNGRCKAGKCTGWLTSSGHTEHSDSQIQPSDCLVKVGFLGNGSLDPPRTL